MKDIMTKLFTDRCHQFKPKGKGVSHSLLGIIVASSLLLATGCRADVPPPLPAQKSVKEIQEAMLAIEAPIPPKEQISLSDQVKQFFEAFKILDTQQMETLTGANAGTYSILKGAKITDVTIRALTENEYFGQYAVRFQCNTPGLSPFTKGENLWILQTGGTSTGFGILGFYNNNLLPLSSYKTQGLGRVMVRAEAEVNQLLSYGPPAAFNAAKPLPVDQMVAYSIMKIGEKQFKDGGSFDSGSPSVDKVKFNIWKLFGISNCDVAKCSFYNQEKKVFTQPKSSLYSGRVIDGMENEDGTYSVVVQSYYDPICMLPAAKYQYRLSRNEDNTHKFISCSFYSQQPAKKTEEK